MKIPAPIRRSHSAGLTLVELLVVVAIIVVFVGLVMPPCGGGAVTKGRLTESLGNAKQIATALRMYAEDHGGNLVHPGSDG